MSDQLEFHPPAKAARRGRQRVAQSATTKLAVLEAAARLFIEQGYGATTIDDIVKASGVSVGSIYHQFGGKAEVFVALAQQEMAIRTAAFRKAARKAEAAGETRPAQLFCAGATAHLLEMWKKREISRVLWGDDLPPGFGDFSRRTEAKFILDASGVTLGTPPYPELSAYAVIGLMHAAVAQILQASKRKAVLEIIDYYTDLIIRLAQDEPASEYHMS